MWSSTALSHQKWFCPRKKVSTPAGSSSVTPFRTSHLPAASRAVLYGRDLHCTLGSAPCPHDRAGSSYPGVELGLPNCPPPPPPQACLPCMPLLAALLCCSHGECPSPGDCLLLTEAICMLSHFSTFSYLSKKMHIFSHFISAQRQIFLEYLPFSKVLCFLIMLSSHLTCPIQMISTLPFTNTHISKQSFIVKSCQLILRNKHLQRCLSSVHFFTM